jgi:transposase-like protein
LEIITGTERRRRWRVEEKLRIVAESQQPGATVAEIARRHEVSHSLIWTWRRQVRRGLLRSQMFLPVRVTDDPVAVDPTCSVQSSASRAATPRDGHIEITLADGTTIRAGHDVSLTTLRRVLAALRG